MFRLLLVLTVMQMLAFSDDTQLLKRDYVLPSKTIESTKFSSGELKKFDLYFENFRQALLKSDSKSIENLVKFPVKDESCFEDQCDTTLVTKERILKSIYIKPPYTYEMDFSVRGNRIECYYGYNVTRFHLYFELINNKWVLTEIGSNSC